MYMSGYVNMKVCISVLFSEHTHCAYRYKQADMHSCSERWQWMVRQWSLKTSAKMHFSPAQELDLRRKLDLYFLPLLKKNLEQGHTHKVWKKLKNMWVSLLVWLLHAHTEQEEYQDDSSRRFLLAACQLEADRHRQTPFLIAKAVTAKGKCTVKRELETESSPHASHFICHWKTPDFVQWMKKNPVLVQFHQITHQLSLHIRQGGTTQIVSSLNNINYYYYY